MTSKDRIAKALALATDTKVFEMDSNILHLAPSIFKEQFGDARAIVIADKNTWRGRGGLQPPRQCGQRHHFIYHPAR